MFTRAICRRPGLDAGAGLTTARSLGTPDPDRLLQQHGAYVSALKALGLDVTVLDALPGHPDAYFVEDAAVVLPELVVIARPGAASRRGEAAAMEPVLAHLGPLVRIGAPGTLDGGDVLVVGRQVFVGLSARTNRDGFEQLAAAVASHGYRAVPVPLPAGLHLKSSVNHAGGEVLLVSEALSDAEPFRPFERVVVDVDETYACNVLSVNGHLLHAAGFPRTRRKLAELGVPLIELEMSEARKMDGGLTCLSLRF